MHKHKSKPQGAIILMNVFGLALVVSVDYFWSPSSQKLLKSVEIYSYSNVANPRNEQVAFEPVAGKKYRVHCVHAEKLCEFAKNNPDIRLDVRLGEISPLGEFWAISASAKGSIILPESDQARRYEEMRTKLAWRLFLCVAVTVVSTGFCFFKPVRWN
jgi:hypothetical protein